MNYEKLPTIGSALSIKTRKQGRIDNLSSLKNDEFLLVRNRETSSNLKKRSYRKCSLAITKMNAIRIINFNQSTTKQKEVANLFFAYIKL